MNWKNTFILGLVSTGMSSLACITYAIIYEKAFYVDFSGLVGIPNLIMASLMGCLLMAVGYKLMLNWRGVKVLGWLNVAYGLVSFVSIIGVLGFNLPLDIESPEMFPGMVIPMHFFPLLSILIVYSFFGTKSV